MKSPDGTYFNIGRRLTLTLALLIALILGGNGLVILQFERARVQTDRLTGVSQQLIAVLRLHEGLLSFHQKLNEIVQSKDVARLEGETRSLRTSLQEQTQLTRRTLSYLPPEFRVDPAFLTALDTFETTLPQQLHDITALAAVGDWEVIRLRLDNELRRMEATTSALVKSVDRELAEELPRAVENMRNVQRKILFVVPATALSTVLMAAFFGWAIARRILELRLEERVSERTRIARELHDTLLQSFQAVLMKFHAIAYMIPDRPEARNTLEAVIEQARQAINEGRDTVAGLRSSAAVNNDLARAIRSFGEGLSSEQTGPQHSEFSVQEEGALRGLAPLVRDEIYRIAVEALRNAFRHAEAKQVKVEIRYEKRKLWLVVRDDGKGIEPQILGQGGSPGHHGLPGMRERAKLVGGELTIWSKVDSGTAITLSIPGSIAFAKSSHPRSSIA